MNESIKLFSKKVIFIFSILMSPIFGCLLFADNLNQADRKNYILPVVAGGFLYNMLFAFILRSIVTNPQMLLVALQVVNVAGAFILVGPVWKALLGDIEEYEKKSFVGPLIILILITVAITLFMLKTGKPLLPA
jgi:hypothetical protein